MINPKYSKRKYRKIIETDDKNITIQTMMSANSEWEVDEKGIVIINLTIIKTIISNLSTEQLLLYSVNFEMNAGDKITKDFVWEILGDIPYIHEEIEDWYWG